MDDITKVKERTNIVDVVGEYVKLTKAGRNYKGLSPFKKEKTPSFFVSPDKNMYYDFSSNKGGDAFTFLQEVEGVDFHGALTMLAERAGVKLTNRGASKENKDEKEKLYHAMELACSFFETKFQEAEHAKTYLTGRGVTLATARQFRIGYAPDEWHALRDFLLQNDVAIAIQEKAGLVKKSDQGSYYDRFRSRVLFPITDTSGQVIAFSGRIIGEAANDEHNAKYLNSPDTPLFDKSAVLYGYHAAKQPMRQNDFAIVVEGQMDIVLSHQAGYTNTVATSGTALTETHMGLISRLTKNVAFAFDADSAGIAAMQRAAAIALRKGMDVKVVRIPKGKDPADCIQEDAAVWKKAVREARSVVDFILLYIDSQHYSEAKRALVVRDMALPLIAEMQSGVARGFFVRRVAEHIELAEHAVWEDMAKIARQAGRNSEHSTFAEDISHTPLQIETQEEVYTQLEHTGKDIAAILFWQEGQEEKEIDEAFVQELLETCAVSIEGELAKHAHEKEVLATRGELLGARSGVESAKEMFTDVVRMYARITHEARREELRKSIRHAEHAQDEEKLNQLLAEFQEIQIRISALAE